MKVSKLRKAVLFSPERTSPSESSCAHTHTKKKTTIAKLMPIELATVKSFGLNDCLATISKSQSGSFNQTDMAFVVR